MSVNYGGRSEKHGLMNIPDELLGIILGYTNSSIIKRICISTKNCEDVIPFKNITRLELTNFCRDISNVPFIRQFSGIRTFQPSNVRCHELVAYPDDAMAAFVKCLAPQCNVTVYLQTQMFLEIADASFKTPFLKRVRKLAKKAAGIECFVSGGCGDKNTKSDISIQKLMPHVDSSRSYITMSCYTLQCDGNDYCLSVAHNALATSVMEANIGSVHCQRLALRQGHLHHLRRQTMKEIYEKDFALLGANYANFLDEDQAMGRAVISGFYSAVTTTEQIALVWEGFFQKNLYRKASRPWRTIGNDLVRRVVIANCSRVLSGGAHISSEERALAESVWEQVMDWSLRSGSGYQVEMIRDLHVTQINVPIVQGVLERVLTRIPSLGSHSLLADAQEVLDAWAKHTFCFPQEYLNSEPSLKTRIAELKKKIAGAQPGIV
tara:strand:- start:129 stop:1433 length:1305 start_codon:yes stop_codon:yes gene_type:complete